METMIVIGGAGHGSDRTSLPTLAPRVLLTPAASGPRRRAWTGLGGSDAQPAPLFDPTLDGTLLRRQ